MTNEGLVLGALLLVIFVASCCLFPCLCALCGVRTSEYLERTGRRSGSSPLLMRSTFNRVPMIPIKPSKFHTHPVSAALRTTGSNFIERVAEDLGRTPFFYQCSAADQRRCREGSRKHFWVKDLTVRAAPLALAEHHVLALVDVDYYIDMPSMLVDEFRPTLLYTFQPERVARSTDEYSYTFDKHSRLTYRHSGGGTYTHDVWNYGMDNVIINKPGSLWRFSLPEVASYLVDKRNVGTDHEVVALTPLMKWSWPASIVARRHLSGNVLERLHVVQGDFTRMFVQRADGLYVSTGQVDSFSECTVPVPFDEAIAAVVRTNTVKLSLPTVLAYVTGTDLAKRKAEASVLLLYHRLKTKGGLPPTAYPVEKSVREYDFGVAEHIPSDKQNLVPFMSPFIHGAFTPANNLASEAKCVSGRITGFAQRSKSIQITGFLDRVMREFAEHLLPNAHCLHPLTIDDVYERQGRPSQRQILDRSMFEDPDREVKMFMKKEAYSGVKDPRPISQINGADKREYSAFIYAMAEVIKLSRWYAFGVSPVLIATRVADVLSEAGMCVNTDFSRFDGRVSPVLRELERIVLMRGFDPIYADQLCDLHTSQFNQPAVGRFGTRYHTGTARASGSPETAAFNSLANAFVAYLTFRSTKQFGAFIGRDEAWARLGIYGGDDGLTADVSTEMYVSCARSVGLVLDVEEVQRGSFGVKFLARIYGPNVWHGDRNSCCDLPRQLSKFHTTVSLPPNVTSEAKLLEKVRAFVQTDANTPVLGEYASRVISVVGVDRVFSTRDNIRIWNSDLQLELQYPNQDSGWMNEYAIDSLGEFDFDFTTFRTWLAGTQTIGDLLNPPLCAVPKVASAEVEVIVDGDLLTPSNGGGGQAKVPPSKKSKRAAARANSKSKAPPRPTQKRKGG